MTILPRQPLLNPDLVRPDWASATPRPVGPLWLDKNENLDPVLLKLTYRIYRELDPLSLATYPECAELYRKLARWLGVTPDCLLLTHGSDGAIRMTFEAFVDEGNAVVHTQPTFAMYPVYSQMFGARVRPLEYARGAKGPQLTTDGILGHLSKVRPRLFCLPNPDSPTGSIVPPDELRAIVELCAEIGTVALIDEAYHPFYDWTCIPWVREFRHLIVARTFAKAWGVAGLRIGYAVGHPETIRFLHKLRPMYEASTVSIAFMERMLDHADAMQASVRRLKEGKAHFSKELSGLGFDVLPTEGNFLHVAFGDRAAAVHRALEGKVLYRRDFKEECLKGYSRFSLTTTEGFEKVLAPLRLAANGESK